MSKDFLNTPDISEKNVGVPRKQKFVTNTTPSAVTRYVCISKDGITPHTWREQIQIIKKEDAVAAGGGVAATVTVSTVDSKGVPINTKPFTSETEAPSISTQCLNANNSCDIINEKSNEQSIITSERNVKTLPEADLGNVGVNDTELCSNSVKYEPESLSANGNKHRTKELETNIKVKSVDSRCRTSTTVHGLNSANFEEKSATDTRRRKLFHNRNKTREYILQQKQKRKERFAAEQSKKNMEDEMKKIKLQTLREKSLKIVKTNVKKSLSKKRIGEKSNNLEPDITSNCNQKPGDLQTPAVAVNTESISQKTLTLAKYKVTDSIQSQVPLSDKCDNDTNVADTSSLHGSNGGNSNKSSNVDLEFKDKQHRQNMSCKSSCDSSGGNSNKSSSVDLKLEDNQQMRNELDLKIRAVAKALSAELECSTLCSSYDLTGKMTDDGFNLSLQRPLLRLRDTVRSMQPVTHNMGSRAANIDDAVLNISYSPPTKLKRYDHTEKMKSLEKKMELANHTISMLRENNIIKSVEDSTRGQTGIFKRLDKVLKENSMELVGKSRQKTVESPQQYFSKRSAFPFHTGQHSEATENNRKLLKKRRISNKTNNIQNQPVTSTRMVFSPVPQMSKENSSVLISESSNTENRENVQPQANKYFDQVMNLNDITSSFTHNLQTVERNICVTPLEQKPNPELSCQLLKSSGTADHGHYKRSDKKSQLQTSAVASSDSDSVKDGEFNIQPNQKLKKLLMQQANQIQQYAVDPPLSRDTTTKSPGAVAELFRRAVEREKRERAATRIQALYRGHSTRKITAPLLIGTKSKGSVQITKLQEEECHNNTKGKSRYTEDISGSKVNTNESSDWLQLEPVKPCPYNVMTALRQKLLALQKVSDAKIETQTANICTDQTLTEHQSVIDANIVSTPHQNKEVCTPGLWVEEKSIVREKRIASATVKRKKVQSVKVHSAKENYSSNVERSDNRKKSESNKSYIFSEEAGWIENEEKEKNGIGSSNLSNINKNNITQRSRKQTKTCDSSAKLSVIGSDTEHSHMCNLTNNSESLELPDVHLVRKWRRSENGAVPIPSNSRELCLSGLKQREMSPPTSNADWIEASVHTSSAQTSFPSESEIHNKESIAESISEHVTKNRNYSKKTKSSRNISNTGRAEKSSTKCTEIPHETETKRTVSTCSGSSADVSHNRHKVHTVLESGKMMPPEALHLQFQAEINLLESLEKSRLQLAQIEGLHALSLIRHHKHPIPAGQKNEPEQHVTSDHQQNPATTGDKIDDFEKNRREFNAVIESMRKCAALSDADPEVIDWLTFSEGSNPVKRSDKQENELSPTDKSVLNSSENKEKQSARYSYESSFTSVSEDVSGYTSSLKSKHSEINSVSDSLIEKILETALKKGQISIETYCKYEKLIQEEATRSHEQAILLDTTERALIERFEAEVKTLEINKRQMKQWGEENLVPSFKKKKRALILKLEHDREEINRLRKIYIEASKEWKNLLLQHLNLTKCNMTDNEIVGKEQQERVQTSISINTELGIPVNTETKKSSVPSISSLQKGVSSSIQTKLSQNSAQSKTSAGSDSWSSNQKTENSRRVQSSQDVCTDLTKTETAAQTNSSEFRHSLLPSKRLWSHDEISDWQQLPCEDNRRVRPFVYHRDHSISPMRVLHSEKRLRNADSLHLENSSAAPCFERDSICGKNSSSGREVPIMSSSNSKNSSASKKTPAIISSVEDLCHHCDVSIQVPVSPFGMKRQSSGSDESIMFSHGDTPSEQSDLEGRVRALREQLRRREMEAEKLKQLQKRKAHREELKATEQSLLKQLQVLESYITRTKEQLKQNVNTSSLLSAKPKIKQPRFQAEKSSKQIFDKTQDKSQLHEQTEQNSNHVLAKAKNKSRSNDTSQKSLSNDISTEIPTMILSEHTANSATFLPEDSGSMTLREALTSDDDTVRNEIASVSGSYERRTEVIDSTEDYVYNEENSLSKDNNATIKTSSIKEFSSVSSNQQSSDHVQHTNNFQVLDSCLTQTKDELNQGFNSLPLLAAKCNLKQPGVRTEESTKAVKGKRKEKSQPHEQIEENSNHVLDKADYESSPDDTSQKSISNGVTSEVQTVISSEQTANSISFLPESPNSITPTEVHASEDDNCQDSVVSVSCSYERRTEAPDSTVDYISNEENSYSKTKDMTIKTSSIREITSLSSRVQSAVCGKHAESEQSIVTKEWSGAEFIIPATHSSSDYFLEEDREISEILINSTFDVNNTEHSSTEQCKGSKNESPQQHFVSTSLEPLDKFDEDQSERSDNSVKKMTAERTGSELSFTSTTINEELSEIEETSMSVQHAPVFTEVQDTEILGQTEFETVVNVSVSVPQDVSDTKSIPTSAIEIKNAIPEPLKTGKEESRDNNQVVLLSAENQSQLSEEDISEESVLNYYSNKTYGNRDVTEFCQNSNDSTYTESHPAPVQLNTTFVIEQKEYYLQDQTDEQSKIAVDSKVNENRLEKLKLVDSITESIMLQLLKDSFVLPNSKWKESKEIPNVNEPSKTVSPCAHKFTGLAKEMQPDSRTVILDEPNKDEIFAAEQGPKPVDYIHINDTTFLLDESSKSEKNTSELVDEMLNHCLKDATSDVLHIYNIKISNSDRQSPSIEISGSRSDLRIPDHDTICKTSEITLKDHNTHLSVNDMINDRVTNLNAIENGSQDMISFTSPDSKRVQEHELSVEDVLRPVSEHSSCEKLMGRSDYEELHETGKEDVSSGCLATVESDSQLNHRLTTAHEAEEPLPDGCKSTVATQNGKELKDISHLQKVEVRGKQSVNNETFPPGWFDEDLDLSNSWREAEQLRLQQLHIEQEIRRLEEQQHQQQALVLVREIPDKPPPPYTPRGTTLQSSSPLYLPSSIGASAPRHRLIELVAEATPLLTSTCTPSMLPPEDFCTGYNSSIRRFIYDLGRSLVNEAVSVPGTDDEYGEETSPQQITVKRSQEAVRAHVTRRATALLDGSAGAGPNSAGKLRRLAVGPRWRRRDHVDELLVREARDEEPGWIDYRHDEAQLRNETACALLCDLLDDTVTAITTAISRRMAHKTTVTLI